MYMIINIFTTFITASGTPIKNGIGAKRYSDKLAGKTGMKICCHTKG